MPSLVLNSSSTTDPVTSEFAFLQVSDVRVGGGFSCRQPNDIVHVRDKKHPGLAVIDLHLLLGQLDVHPLPDELRRDAVAMRAVGSVESNAVSLVHGVDLPFAVLIGMSGQTSDCSSPLPQNKLFEKRFFLARGVD